MNPEPAPNKRDVRRKLRVLVQALTGAEVAPASSAAQALFREQAVWRQARAVLFYAPFAQEIDLSPLLEEGLRAGKAIALPRFVKETGVYDAFQVLDFRRDCATGHYGITEPRAQCPQFPLKQLDLALVPGVGFDTTGRRLGRGQGYYDRLLAHFTGIKCGVAFDQQLVQQIPGEAHDVRMNFILTPTRWLEISE